MYPEETITTGAKGKREARVLISSGKDFVIYGYREVDSDKKLDKYSILLRHSDGRVEHLFIVPMGKGRELIVKHTFEKEKRAIYDEERKKIFEF